MLRDSNNITMSSSTELANLSQLTALPQQASQQSYSNIYSSSTNKDATERMFTKSYPKQGPVPKRKNMDEYDSDDLINNKKLRRENFPSENSDDFSFNSQTSSPWSDHSSTGKSNCLSTGGSPSFNAHVSLQPSPSNTIDGGTCNASTNGGINTHSDTSESFPDNLPLPVAQADCKQTKQKNLLVEQHECLSSVSSPVPGPTSIVSSPDVFSNAVYNSLENTQGQSSNANPTHTDTLTHTSQSDIKDRKNQIPLTESPRESAVIVNPSQDVGEVSSSPNMITSSEEKLQTNPCLLQFLGKLQEAEGKKRVVVGNFYKAVLDKTSSLAGPTHPMKFMYWVYVIGEGYNLAHHIKSVTYTMPDSYAPKNVLTLRSPFEIIGPSREEFQLTLKLNPLKRKYNKPSRLRYTIKLGNSMDPDAYSGQWRIGHETLYTVSLVDVPRKSATPPRTGLQVPIFSPAFLPPTSCVPETDQLVIPFYSSANDLSQVPSHISGVAVVNIEIPVMQNFTDENIPLSTSKLVSQDAKLAVSRANSTLCSQLPASSTSCNNLRRDIVPTAAGGTQSSTSSGGCRVSSESFSSAVTAIGMSDANSIGTTETGNTLAHFNTDNFSRHLNGRDEKLSDITPTSAHDVSLSFLGQGLSHGVSDHEEIDTFTPDVFGFKVDEIQDAPWSNSCPSNEEDRIARAAAEIMESNNISSPKNQCALNGSSNIAQLNTESDSAIEPGNNDLLEIFFANMLDKSVDNQTLGTSHNVDCPDDHATHNLSVNSAEFSALDEFIKDVESHCLSTIGAETPSLFVPSNFLEHNPTGAKEGVDHQKIDENKACQNLSSTESQEIPSTNVSELQDPLAGHPWASIEEKLSACSGSKRNVFDSSNEVLLTNCVSKNLHSSENSLRASSQSTPFFLNQKQVNSESVTPTVLPNQSTTFGDVLNKLNKNDAQCTGQFPLPGSVNLANAQIVNHSKIGEKSMKDNSKSSTGNGNGLGSASSAANGKKDCPADDSDDDIQILSVVKKAPTIRLPANLLQTADQNLLAGSAAVPVNSLNKPEIIGPVRVPTSGTRGTPKPISSVLKYFNPSRLKMVKLGEEGDPALQQLVASLKKGNANNILRSDQVFRPSQSIQISTPNSSAGKVSSAKLVRGDSANVMRVPTSNVVIQTSGAALKNFSIKAYSNAKTVPATVSGLSILKNVSVPQTSSAKPPIKNITVKTNGKDFTIPVVQSKNLISSNVKTQIPVFKITSDGKLLKSTPNQVEKLAPLVVNTRISAASKPVTITYGHENLTSSISVPCSLPSVVNSTSPSNTTSANSDMCLKSSGASVSQNSVSVLPAVGSLGSTVKSVQVCPTNSTVFTNGNLAATAKSVQIPRTIVSVSEYPTSSVPAPLKTGNLISSVTVLPRRTLVKPAGQNGKFNIMSVSNFQNLPLGTKIQLDPVSTGPLLTNSLLKNAVNQRSVSTSSRVFINKSTPVQTLQPVKLDVSKSEPEGLCSESTSHVVSSSNISEREGESCDTVGGNANIDVDNVISGDANGTRQACVASCSSLSTAPCLVSSKDFISPTASPALMPVRSRDASPRSSPACAITHEPEILNISPASCGVIVDESCAVLHNGEGSHLSLSCVSKEKAELSNKESESVSTFDTSAISENGRSSNAPNEVPASEIDFHVKNEVSCGEQSSNASVLSKNETIRSVEKSDNKSAADNSVGTASGFVEESNFSDGEIKNISEGGSLVQDSAPPTARKPVCRLPSDYITTKNIIYVNSGEKSVKFAQVLNENHNTKLTREVKDPSKIMLKHADLNMNLLTKLDGSGQKFVLSRPALGSPLILNGRKLYRIMPVSAVPSLASLKKISTGSIVSPGKNTPISVKEEKIIAGNSSLIQSQFGRLKKSASALSSQQLNFVNENKFGKSGVCAAVNSFLQTRDNKSDVFKCVTLGPAANASIKKTNNGVVQREDDDNDPDLDSLTQEELANLSKYRRDKLEDQKKEKLLKNIPLLQSACGEDHKHCNPSMFIRLAVRAFPLYRPDVDSCGNALSTAGDYVSRSQKMLRPKKISQVREKNSFSKPSVNKNFGFPNSDVNIKEEISDTEPVKMEEDVSESAKFFEANGKVKKSSCSASAEVKTEAPKNPNLSVHSSSDNTIDILAPQLVVHLVRDSRQQFLAHSLMKQRALEYQRARAVLRHMRQWCESCASLWSLRAIVAWARQNGYTPCPSRPAFLKSDWFIPEARLGYLHHRRMLLKKADASGEVPKFMQPGGLQALCEQVFSEEHSAATEERNNGDGGDVKGLDSPSGIVLAWDQIVLPKSSNLTLRKTSGAPLAHNTTKSNTTVAGVVDEPASLPNQVTIKKECEDDDYDSSRAGSLPCVSSIWDTFSDLVIGGHSAVSKNQSKCDLKKPVLNDFSSSKTCKKNDSVNVPSSEVKNESLDCSGSEYETKGSVEASLSLDVACAAVRSIAHLTQHKLAPHSQLLPPAGDCDPAVGNKKAVFADVSGLVLFKSLNMFLEDLVRSSLAVAWSSKCRQRPPQPATESAPRINLHQTCPPASSSEWDSGFASRKNNSAGVAVNSKLKSSTVRMKEGTNQKLESRIAPALKKAGKPGNSVTKKFLSVSDRKRNVSDFNGRSKDRDRKPIKTSPGNFKQGKGANSAQLKNSGKDVKVQRGHGSCSSRSAVGNRRGRSSAAQKSNARDAKPISNYPEVLNGSEFSKNRAFQRKHHKNSAKKHARQSLTPSSGVNNHSGGKVRAKITAQPTNLLKARMVNSMRGAPAKGLRKQLSSGHVPAVLKDEDRLRLSSCGPVKEITSQHVLRALHFTRPQFKVIGSKVLTGPLKK